MKRRHRINNIINILLKRSFFVSKLVDLVIGKAFSLFFKILSDFPFSFMFTTALLSVHLTRKFCWKLYEWCKYLLNGKLFPSLVVCSKRQYPLHVTVESFVHETDGVQCPARLAFIKSETKRKFNCATLRALFINRYKMNFSN